MSVEFKNKQIDHFRAQLFFFRTHWAIRALVAFLTLSFCIRVYYGLSITENPSPLLFTIFVAFMCLGSYYLIAIAIAFLISLFSVGRSGDLTSMVSLTETAIIDDTAGTKVECKYGRIAYVKNDKYNLYIQAGGMVIVIVPYRAFGNLSNYYGFLSMLKGYIEPKKFRYNPKKFYSSKNVYTG